MNPLEKVHAQPPRVATHAGAASASRLAALARLLRPHQWTKNLLCLAGALFSGRFGHPDALARAILTLVVFCAASSAVYALNDLVDRERDREHPRKRLRPLASGAVTTGEAVVLATVLGVLALAGGWALGTGVLACVLLYIGNNLAYTFRVKHLPLFDVLSIAAGFVFRLLAGVYAVDELPTTWIALCVFFLAVFLGFAKRRAELAALTPDDGGARRPVLAHYSVHYLDFLLNSSAVMAVMCYALFTTSSGKNPTLVVGVPIVFYAIMHYKRLVMLLEGGEEPERILVRDPHVRLSVLVWLLTYFAVLYFDLHLFR